MPKPLPITLHIYITFHKYSLEKAVRAPLNSLVSDYTLMVKKKNFETKG